MMDGWTDGHIDGRTYIRTCKVWPVECLELLEDTLSGAIVDDAREKSWSHCPNEAHHLLLVSLYFVYF